jgi:flagellar M-ring protein FliF
VSKSPLLPPQLVAFVAAIRSRVAGLSRPVKVFAATTLTSAVLLGSLVLYRETHEPYAVLFSQLDPEDASSIVAKLKEAKTPYRISGGGSIVEVPEAKVPEIRMELVGAGLPRGGGVGFESFDKMRLGATEFEQRVLYRRSLEGEMARTIGSLAAVQSARVHLVLPEKSVFVSRSEPASASILLHLRPGRSLGPSEVRGIVSLVSAAVPGLVPERVAVVTGDGTMLRKPRPAGGEGGAAGDDEQGGEQRALEGQLEDRARAMLERVVGTGHVDVRVTAEVDPGRVEHTEDHYDPSRTALRSEEQTRERSTPAFDDTIAGVPGAESNLSGQASAASRAPAASSAARPAPSGSVAAAPVAPAGLIAQPSSSGGRTGEPFRESHTRNFEVDHVSDKRLVGPGALKRIGVAVILDGVMRDEGGIRRAVPRDRAELDKLAALVRSAVGANDARGDSITVESLPFESATPLDELPAAPAVATTGRAFAWKSFAIPGAVALVLLAVACVALVKRRGAAAKALVTPALPASVTVDQLPSAKLAGEDLRARALERAAEDPATAALVLRLWLGASDADVKG